MNHRVFIFLLIILAACSSKSGNEQTQQNEIQQETSEKSKTSSLIETFDDFYKNFKSDSVYQISRIVFPLTVETYDLDTEAFVTSKMDREEWSFMNFEREKPYHFNVESAKDTMKVNVQIEETGVSVDYVFTLVDNKWKLVKIVDQST